MAATDRAALADEVERLLKFAEEIAWEAERTIKDDEPERLRTILNNLRHLFIKPARRSLATLRDRGPTCSTCRTPLNLPNRPWTRDCGGDCLACMAEAGDPECGEAMSAGVAVPAAANELADRDVTRRRHHGLHGSA